MTPGSKIDADYFIMAKKALPPTVHLRYPMQYVFSGMANRFKLIREEGFTIAHFGLVGEASRLLDKISCVIPADTLITQKENLVQYSDKIGLPKKKPLPWNPPEREITDASFSIPVVDFIHLSNWDDAFAEICFWNYSRAQASEMATAKIGDGIMTHGVAMIRCDLELQRQFLVALYD